MSFDAGTAGTLESEWIADPRLDDRPELDLDGVDELLVVAAHPDDETLGAGGLIRELSDRGLPITVVIVTDGGASHPHERGMVNRREDEAYSAILQLAPGAMVRFLGFADGQTREHRDDIAAALAPLVLATSRRTLVLAPWRGDGHRDHRVVGEIVAELVDGARRFAEYPVWLWHWSTPGDERMPWARLVSLPIDAHAKTRALAMYESQQQSETPVLRPDFIEHFERDREFFVVEQHALTAHYFDEVYNHRSDPWRLATRWYEQRKRAITIASLPGPHYAKVLEIGCSIGVLTEQLADLTDDLLAIDVSAVAVEQARARLGERADVRRVDVLSEFPHGTFDLVVLSEVGYYFGTSGLATVLDEIEAGLSADGTLVACHWRHPVADYPLTGDEVHEAIARRGLHRLARHVEDDFILEVFSRDARSVAQRTGLA